MKTLLVIVALAAASLLAGCASIMPAWFQKDEIVPRSAPGTKIYCDAVNQTDPQLVLEDVFINDVNVGAAIDDTGPLEWGQKFSFQIGYGLWQNSAQDVRDRAYTGGGFGEMAILANVYAIAHLPDGTQIAVYPKGTSTGGVIRLSSKTNNSLLFEGYKIARPTPTSNPRK